jgi:hypothetical protein
VLDLFVGDVVEEDVICNRLSAIAGETVLPNGKVHIPESPPARLLLPLGLALAVGS